MTIIDMHSKIIDMHSHWGTERGYPWRTPEQLAMQRKTFKTDPVYVSEDAMAQHLRERGVRAILDSGFTVNLPQNELISFHDYGFDVQRKHPDAILGFWLSLNPATGKLAVDELRRCLQQPCFIGLSMTAATKGMPAAHDAWRPLLDVCAEARVPVLVPVGHTQASAGLPGGGGIVLDDSHPRHVDRLAATYPGLFIIASRPAWPWQDEMISVMLHKPNVWNELHGWSPKYFPPALVHDIERRLRDRILFGVDYPMLSYERVMDDWRKLPLSEATIDKVIYRNAAALLSRVRTGTPWPDAKEN